MKTSQSLSELLLLTMEEFANEHHLTTRTKNCLTKSGIPDVGVLISHDPEMLLRIENLGRTSLTEIQEALENMALGLPMHASISSCINDAQEWAKSVLEKPIPDLSAWGATTPYGIRVMYPDLGSLLEFQRGPECGFTKVALIGLFETYWKSFGGTDGDLGKFLSIITSYGFAVNRMHSGYRKVRACHITSVLASTH